MKKPGTNGREITTPLSKNPTVTQAIIPIESIERIIYLIRGRRVILDSSLAKLYGVTTFNLNKAVKRNRNRFPDDFMFQLTGDEFRSLRFQTGISKKMGKGGRRYRPYVFTEEGVAMLSSVLHSQRAIRVNVAIMRAFVRIRKTMTFQRELSIKLNDLERLVGDHDIKIRRIFGIIQELITPQKEKRKRIGFRARP